MVDEPRSRAATWLIAAVSLAVGVLHWLLFFGIPPVLPREAADWPKEFRYYAVLQQAVTEWRVPYFVSVSLQDTRKFLAIPETVLSPQILLLRWVSIDQFFVVHILLLQAVALLACLALRRRYKLSIPSFALLWLLLGFNGHITSHLAIGHSMWGGYFFLPWFFLLLLDVVEGPLTARTPIAIGGVLGLILLQGSFHPFVWCVLFLLLLFVFDSLTRRSVAEALLWSGAFAAWRLVPAAVILLGRRSQSFETGYASVGDLLAGLVSIRDAAFARRGTGGMGGVRWWEFDSYIGVVALVFVVVFAAIGLSGAHRSFRRLFLPVTITALLSYDGLYRLFHVAHVPLLNAERVSSRLLILPLGVVIVVAVIAAEEWRRRTPGWGNVVLTLVALATAFALALHSQVWSVPSVTHLLPPPPHARDLAIEIADASGGADRAYLASVYASAAATAMTIVMAVVLWRRRVRR
jgi:hypothetical protein